VCGRDWTFHDPGRCGHPVFKRLPVVSTSSWAFINRIGIATLRDLPDSSAGGYSAWVIPVIQLNHGRYARAHVGYRFTFQAAVLGGALSQALASSGTG